MIRAAILHSSSWRSYRPSVHPSRHAQITLGSPSWSQLSPQEKQMLAPLASDWDKLDAQRKQKWRGIAQRYPKMSPTSSSASSSR